MTDKLINLDAAIEVVRREGLSTGGEHAVVYVHDIIEALSALPAVGGWLDIESAPRDGTTFLAWCKHGQYVISWDDDLWTVDDNKSDYIPLRGEWPTHWQPLPAPPEIE